MLMLLCILYHASRFRLRNFARENATYSLALFMDQEHQLLGFVVVFLEELLQYLHYKFHRGIVIVHEHHGVKRGLLKFFFFSDIALLIRFVRLPCHSFSLLISEDGHEEDFVQASYGKSYLL